MWVGVSSTRTLPQLVAVVECYSGIVDEARQFGRYRVTRSLGSGAMGEVYEAVDDVLGREVAIKTVKPVRGALQLDDRFKQEARAIAQLSHPGVVQLFDIDLAAEPPYLVMERVAGPSLSAKLQEGPLRTGDLVPLGIQIARALAAAHAAGVYHRDVKPSNILGAGNGMWKLADFGVAHVPSSSLTMTGQFVGSPAYAAPEALVKGVTGAASDVYGLGATLYECAAGKWPRLEAKGALLAPVPPLAQLAPHVPAHVSAAIDRAVALDHEKRPTAAELAELLAKGPSGAARPAAHASWKPWVFAGGAAIALAIGIAVTRSHDAPAVSLPANVPQQPDEQQEIDDLNDIANQANSGDIDGARNRLHDYEESHGEDELTRDLRHQLDRARKPKHHGRPGD